MDIHKKYKRILLWFLLLSQYTTKITHLVVVVSRQCYILHGVEGMGFKLGLERGNKSRNNWEREVANWSGRELAHNCIHAHLECIVLQSVQCRQYCRVSWRRVIRCETVRLSASLTSSTTIVMKTPWTSQFRRVDTWTCWRSGSCGVPRVRRATKRRSNNSWIYHGIIIITTSGQTFQ